MVNGGNEDRCFWLAGAVAAGVSLIVQAASWFWPALAGPAAQPLAGPMPRQWGHKGIGAPPPTMGHRKALVPPPLPMASPFARPAKEYAAHAAGPDGSLPFRWGITRAFWSVIAFCLFGGAVVLFMMLVLIPLRGGDRPLTIFGCVACASFLIFALSKTTPQRRQGFWRETERPFLIALCLTGLGALLITLADDCWHSPEEMVIVTSGLVICGTLLLLSLFVGRRPPARREHLFRGAEGENHGSPIPAATEPAGEAFPPPVSPFAGPANIAPTVPVPLLRWAPARVFWSIVAFCLFGAGVVLFTIPVLIPSHEIDLPGTIIGCIACLSFLIFALSKTTEYRRHGFWRETFRPFLLACALTGIGASITAKLTTGHWDGDTTDLITVSGLVNCVVLFLLAFFIGRKPPVRREPPWPNADPQQSTQVPSVREPTVRQRGTLGLVLGFVVLLMLLFMFFGVRSPAVHRVERSVVGPRTYPSPVAISDSRAREEYFAQVDQDGHESEILVERDTDESGNAFGTVDRRPDSQRPRYRTPPVPVVPRLLVVGPRHTTWMPLVFLAALPALLAVLALRIRRRKAQHRRMLHSAPNAAAPPDRPSE
jgi:hypothetical protein